MLYVNNAIYVQGNSFSPLTDTNLLTNAMKPNYGGIGDVYVGKFTNTIQPIWGMYIGGTNNDRLEPMFKLHFKDNSLYFSLQSMSSNFLTSPNIYQSTNYGAGDVVVMKFSDNGNLIWGSFFGGNDT